MVYKITDACINCGYCELECPSSAIYEPGMRWTMKEGTGLQGTVTLSNGRKVDVKEMQTPLSDTFYFIVSEKCTECSEEFDEPQCQVVCPDPAAIERLSNREKPTRARA